MTSPVWTLTLVPHGKRIEPPLPKGTVALDVGNGSPGSGIFDHHHGVTSSGSTAELLLRHWDKFEERLKGQTDIKVITHEQPDFDALAALFLAWSFLFRSSNSSSAFRSLGKFASKVDQGHVRPGEQLTLYTFVLMVGPWLTTEEGLSFRHSEAMNQVFQDGCIQVEDPSADACTAALTLRLLRDWQSAPEWLPPKHIEERSVSEPVRKILRPLSERLSTQVQRCQRDLKRAQAAGDTGQMEVRQSTQNGSQREVSFVRVVDPDANPSVLGKYLRTWGQREHGAPVVSILQFREAQRTIVSVPPESSLTLKGLGLFLERMERQERKRQGRSDEDAPRFQAVDDGGQVHVDPLFSSSDPWYDGRGHNFTIVDAPRSGSLLSLEQVYQAVVQAEWIECAEEYESSPYQEWEALRQIG
jgi:hypothetical protein